MSGERLAKIAAREARDILISVVGEIAANRARKLKTPHYEALRHLRMAELLRDGRVPRLAGRGSRRRLLARTRARFHDNQALRWGSRAWAEDRMDGCTTARRCGIPGA